MSETNNAAPQATATPAPVSPETKSQVSEATSEESDVAESEESAEESSSESQVAADASAILADPTATKAEKAAAKKKLKSIKLKVDGQEFEEELPFEIEDDPKQIEYLRKNLQMSKVSHKRMQEAAEQQEQFRQFIEYLKENPEEVLSNPNINVDLKKFATKIIEQELENEKKSPEQLKAEKLEKELKKLQEERAREKAEAEKRDKERIQREQMERYDLLLDQAFKKFPDVPQTPQSIIRISQYMQLAIQNGMDVSPEDVMPIVQKELEDELSHRIKNAPDDYIEKLIGKERLDNFRKKKLKAAKDAKAAAPKVVDTGTSSATKEEIPVKKTTIRDFFKV